MIKTKEILKEKLDLLEEASLDYRTAYKIVAVEMSAEEAMKELINVKISGNS